MKSQNLFKYFMVAATVGILFTSCRRDKDELDKDTSAASDNALAEGSYNDVNNMADEAAAQGTLTSYMGAYSSDEKAMLSTCAVVTNDSVTIPHLLTIDFGTSNCLCADGRYRRGIVNVSYSGHYRDSLSVHTITFTNYFVNDNNILGTKTVTNNGHNSSGNLTFSVHVDGHIIKSDGGEVTWTSDRTREWIAGELTPTWYDDVYLITGTASGTNAAGNSFTAAIITPLRKEIGCHNIVSGTFSLTPSGKPVRMIDFGSGTCDNQATVTISGHTYNITLH